MASRQGSGRVKHSRWNQAAPGKIQLKTALIAPPDAADRLVLVFLPLSTSAPHATVVWDEPDAAALIRKPHLLRTGALVLAQVKGLPTVVALRRGGRIDGRRLLLRDTKGPHLFDEVLGQKHGRRQVLALASGVGMDSGIDTGECCAPELDLTLRRGAAVHAGVTPEVCQVVAQLLVDGPCTEAELLEPLAEFGVKSARPMESMLWQVDISMAIGHRVPAGS